MWPINEVFNVAWFCIEHLLNLSNFSVPVTKGDTCCCILSFFCLCRRTYWSFVQFLKHYLFSSLQRQWTKILHCYSNSRTGLRVLSRRHWSFLPLLIKDIPVLWHMSFVSWRLTHLRLSPFLCHSWYSLSDTMMGWEFLLSVFTLSVRPGKSTNHSIYTFWFIIPHRIHIAFL
jgi:hypothetical protein